MSTSDALPADILKEAMAQIRMLLHEAKERNLPEASRACLATASQEARPSARTVYIATVQDDGLVFFVNIESGKGRQLTDNPQAAICLFWPELQAQATIEGPIQVMTDSDSNRLWDQRPRDSQLAAWASDQASDHAAKSERMDRREWLQNIHSFDKIPRPETWKAILLQPARIEFWATGWQHLRSRNLYEKDADNIWHIQQDNP